MKVSRGAGEARLVTVASSAPASAISVTRVLASALGLMSHVFYGVAVPALVHLVHVTISTQEFPREREVSVVLERRADVQCSAAGR